MKAIDDPRQPIGKYTQQRANPGQQEDRRHGQLDDLRDRRNISGKLHVAHLYEEFDSLQNASEHVLPPVFPSEEHLESTFPMSDRPLYTLLKRSSSVDNIESAMNPGQDFIGKDLCDHFAFRQGKVDVDRRGGGWNDNYHPVATAAAVTATVAVTAAVIGLVVRTVPANCAPYTYNGVVYQQCGSSWYQPQYVGSSVEYVVVSPPY